MGRYPHGVCDTQTECLPATVLVLQPVEFTAGLDVGSGDVKQPAGEGAGGLFSGASGPKPPPALSQAVLGMKPGGKVSLALLQSCLLCMHNIA